MAVLGGLKNLTGNGLGGQMTIMALLHVRNDLAATLKAKLISLAIKTTGGLHQAVHDDAKFTSFERCEIQPHLGRHLAATYIRAFLEEAEGLLAVPSYIKFRNMVSRDTL